MKRIIILLLFSVAVISCEKRYEIPSLSSFDVTTERLKVAVGDSIIFNIAGQPENVVFWSGEAGKRYSMRNTVEVLKDIVVNFQSAARIVGPDVSIINVKISSDYSGANTKEAIEAATWHNIKSSAAWASNITGNNTPSGTINIDQYLEPGKSAYIAFQYDTKVVKSHTQWIIQQLSIMGTNSQGGQSVVVSSIGDAAFKSVDLLPIRTGTVGWNVSSANQITANRSNDSVKDDWAISRAFTFTSQPDKGQAIKNITKDLKSFLYAYDVPGIYKVAFVATNGNLHGLANKVKEIEIEVTN